MSFSSCDSVSTYLADPHFMVKKDFTGLYFVPHYCSCGCIGHESVDITISRQSRYSMGGLLVSYICRGRPTLNSSPSISGPVRVS